MTCQPTPGGKLVKELNKNLNTDTSKGRTLITENGGQPALAYLKKKDPFRPAECRFSICMVNPVQDCSDMGAFYEITCTTCKEPVQGRRRRSGMFQRSWRSTKIQLYWYDLHKCAL